MDKLEKLALWHQISSASYLGPVRFRHLLHALGENLHRVFEMSDEELKRLKGVGTAQAIKGIREQADKYHESLDFMKEQVELASASGGEILLLDDKKYPRFLAESKMCHAIIYCVGDIDAFIEYDKSLAIVGTRKASPRSLEIARKTAYELALDGWVIVSGMAKGIDSEAHEGALEADGKTIAVLGCGPDVIYPREARSLYHSIKQHGLVLSEYPFGERVDSIRLKKRNKTTVALSLGAFLVESDASGGAMNAVKACDEQNKPALTILPDWPCKKSGNEKAAADGAIVLPHDSTLVLELKLKIKEWKGRRHRDDDSEV